MTRPMIDPEIASLICELRTDEKQQLEENIRAEGCRDSLVVAVWPPEYECDECHLTHDWKEADRGEYDFSEFYYWTTSCCGYTDRVPYILIDGHNRLEICERLGIDYRVEEMSFSNREEAMDWIDRNQLGRRNLTPDQFKLILGRHYNREKKGRGGDHKSKGQNDPLVNAAERIAADHGVSPATVKRAGKYAEAVEEVRRTEPEVVARGEREILARAKEIRTARSKVKQEKRREAYLEQRTATKIEPAIDQADALQWLKEQSDCDLLLTDPPYMTDVPDIGEFARSWLPLALSRVKPTGRAYIFVGAYPEELHAYLSVKMPEQVLVWTYRNTIGPSAANRYNLNWQAILYYCGPDAPPLNCPELNEQFAVQDVSAPDGRHGNRIHKWQKPDALAERIILHATKPRDLVLDPFCGSGTFLYAAGRLGRLAKGCDKVVADE